MQSICLSKCSCAADIDLCTLCASSTQSGGAPGKGKKRKKRVHYLSGWTEKEFGNRPEATPSRGQRKPTNSNAVPMIRSKALNSELLTAAAAPWDKEDLPKSSGKFMERNEKHPSVLVQ